MVGRVLEVIIIHDIKAVEAVSDPDVIAVGAAEAMESRDFLPPFISSVVVVS